MSVFDAKKLRLARVMVRVEGPWGFEKYQALVGFVPLILPDGLFTMGVVLGESKLKNITVPAVAITELLEPARVNCKVAPLAASLATRATAEPRFKATGSVEADDRFNWS